MEEPHSEESYVEETELTNNRNRKIKGFFKLTKKYWWLALLVLIVGLVVFIATRQAYKPTKQDAAPAQSTSQTQPEAKEFRFARLPFDIKDIGSIAPVGEFGGINRQSAPNSHQYGNYRHYIFSKKPGEYAYNVYVPADGKITGFRHHDQTKQFRFDFRINDKAYYYIDHIQSLSPEILTKLKPLFGDPPRYTQAVEQVEPGISVKAGDILGQTGLVGIAWDWGVMDETNCQDIIHPEHYQQDRCPRSAFDFMTDQMKSDISSLAGYWTPPPNGLGLQAVKTMPILGQYAHDKAGTLSGGWFQVLNSWQNAFFVPDSYEPNALQIRLAIPELSIFGVWTRVGIGTGSVNPDPKKVTAQSGIVSYVLGKNNARDNSEYGVLLTRVNNDETTTVETLVNRTTPPSNPAFTSKAITLKR